MSGYSTVQNHQSMFFDKLRNSYYSAAIEKVVDIDSVVLELGAGLGLHGFMSARKGARKVYLVEPESIIDVTRQLVSANNLSEQVECIRGRIEEIKLPENVDLIISVFTGNFLLSEDLLPSLFYARDKYLSPGGKLIPDRALMEVVPVSAPDYYEKHINCWSDASQPANFELVRKYAVNSLYYDEPKERKAEYLSDPAQLIELDFMTANEASCQSKIQVKISQNGVCHGILGWFRARLGEQWLSTSPEDRQMHWSQAFLPLAEPVDVKKGDVLFIELNRPEFGEWTWTVTSETTSQRLSTFLSEPVTPATLEKKSDKYKPRLSQSGKATQDVLLRMNGQELTEKIIDDILTEYQNLFPARKYADQFVKRIVEKYGS